MQKISPTVLITGGSSGIGFELAKLFAADGYTLVLVSKPEEELAFAKNQLLKSFPNASILCIRQDLSLPDAAFVLHKNIIDKNIIINVLVNNAGFGTFGYLQDTSLERECEMLRLNVNTVHNMTHLFLRDMLKRNEGFIINMASIAAFQANPSFASYSATKSFVHYFTQALASELREQKTAVRAMSFCPVMARTGFQKAAKMERTNTFDGMFTLEADAVAQECYASFKAGHDFRIPKWYFHYLHKIVRRLPTRLLIAYGRQHTKIVR